MTLQIPMLQFHYQKSKCHINIIIIHAKLLDNVPAQTTKL